MPTIFLRPGLIRRRRGIPRPGTGTPTPPSFDLNLGFIGDSIWDLENGYGSRNIPTIVGQMLEKTGAIRTVNVVNRAVSGTDSAAWVPGGGGEPLYGDALAAFLAAGVTHVVVMLGANDAANSTTDTIYDGNIKAIVNVGASALVNQGLTVILCYPIWRNDVPGLDVFLEAYHAKIDGIIAGDPDNVLQGDVLGYDWFRDHEDEMDDPPIHCNEAGSESHATMVSWAIWDAVYDTDGAAAASILGGGDMDGGFF